MHFKMYLRSTNILFYLSEGLMFGGDTERTLIQANKATTA